MYFLGTRGSTWFAVFVVFLVTLMKAANQHLLQEVPLEEPGLPPYRSFTALKASTIYQCMEICWALTLCRSMFYSRQSNMCDLLDVTSEDAGVYKTPLSETVLLRRMLPQVVAGSCWNHDCRINERCIPRENGYTCVQHDLSTVRCPPTSGRKGDTCVWLVLRNMTRNEAKDACGNGGSLLVINKYAFDDFVRVVVSFLCRSSLKQICSPFSFWFGLEYSDRMDSLVWSSTGTKLLSTDYHRFQSFPSYIPSTQCIGMYRFEGEFSRFWWKVMDCDDKIPLLCYSVNAVHWT